MTEALAAVAAPAAAQPTAPGSAVLALAPGDELAIWHVSPEGMPTGVRTYARQEAFGDADAAREVLTLLARRAITAYDPEDVPVALMRLTEVAGLDVGVWWADQVFSPLDSFRDTVIRRWRFPTAPWIRNFDTVPDDFDGLLRLSGLRGSSGADAAKTVSRVLRWQVGLWLETEQVDNTDAPLPPSWLAAVRAAKGRRLPL